MEDRRKLQPSETCLLAASKHETKFLSPIRKKEGFIEMGTVPISPILNQEEGEIDA